MFSKNTRFGIGLTVMLALAALGSSCAKNPDDTVENKDKGKPYVSKNDEGTVTGKVSFAGTPPTAIPINTAADPVCASKNPNLQSEENVIKDGKLANVFVYIKDGTLADKTKISDWSFKVPSEAVTLDQKGCQYVPHVVGIQVKQNLHVTNSDPTQHNIHPTPSKGNEEWNQTQPSGAAPIERSFTNAEVVIPVKCNQHPWMKSYIGVLKHPFFAVSAADGTFTIKGVPPGSYTIAAWHEGGGKGTETTQKITVGAKGNVTADFSFGGTASVQPSSLQMMPAIQFPTVGHH
jgi:hypothetical protein